MNQKGTRMSEGAEVVLGIGMGKNKEGGLWETKAGGDESCGWKGIAKKGAKLRSGLEKKGEKRWGEKRGRTAFYLRNSLML